MTPEIIEQVLTDPDTIIRLATDLKEERRRRVELEKETRAQQCQLEEQKPLVEFANTVAKSCDNILMRDMAKLLCEEHINIGEKRLYRLLRSKSVLMSGNDPYQSFVDRGYFVVKEAVYMTPYGERLNRTTLVTPRGQIWMVSKVKEWMDEAA